MKDFIHIDDSIVYEYLTNNSTNLGQPGNLTNH
jgi:hypothetical protein